ncbi:MAG TPA: hypothetical protein VFQ53_22700 [Kofleriaceae bacterium]|nr:hypothetical protein [Kofleriaceae bacterium]
MGGLGWRMRVGGQLDTVCEWIARLEPAPHEPTLDELAPIAKKLELIDSLFREVATEVAPSEPAELEERFAVACARFAALAIAAGTHADAQRWLAEAERYARSETTRDLATAGRATPERFRVLVHGEYMFPYDRAAEARTGWQRIVDENPDDVIARRARAHLARPIPMKRSDAPSIGTARWLAMRLLGRRDERADGSWLTTHWLCIGMPLVPLGFYRVCEGDKPGALVVLSREKMPLVLQLLKPLLLVAVTIGAMAAFVYLVSLQH